MKSKILFGLLIMIATMGIISLVPKYAYSYTNDADAIADAKLQLPDVTYHVVLKKNNLDGTYLYVHVVSYTQFAIYATGTNIHISANNAYIAPHRYLSVSLFV
jgi:hypothetical protein